MTISNKTRSGYERWLKPFYAWCDEHGLSSDPATDNTVMLYVESRRHELRHGSIIVMMSAIRFGQIERGHTPHETAAFIRYRRGLSRLMRREPEKKKAATSDITRSMIDTCSGGTIEDVRDAALLSFMFLGAFRRSEVAACRWRDVTISENDIRVFIQRSKNDPDGLGQTVVIPINNSSPYCAGKALLRWRQLVIDAAGYRLNVEELKVLQGAPAYRLAGKMSEQHYAIGNMVPPPLAEAVGRSLALAL